jgi:hypothetical protein
MSHLAELERKHRALDAEIEQELARPAQDDIKLASLKRKKLQIKDNISRIKQGAQIH